MTASFVGCLQSLDFKVYDAALRPLGETRKHLYAGRRGQGVLHIYM